MLDWSGCVAVERSPDKVSGAWLFRGTRVPVKALFENLEGGATVDQFLEWFPGVSREQALAVLEFAEGGLAKHETADILGNREAMDAIRAYEAGKMKFFPLSSLK